MNICSVQMLVENIEFNSEFNKVKEEPLTCPHGTPLELDCGDCHNNAMLSVEGRD